MKKMKNKIFGQVMKIILFLPLSIPMGFILGVMMKVLVLFSALLLQEIFLEVSNGSERYGFLPWVYEYQKMIGNVFLYGSMICVIIAIGIDDDEEVEE